MSFGEKRRKEFEVALENARDKFLESQADQARYVESGIPLCLVTLEDGAKEKEPDFIVAAVKRAVAAYTAARRDPLLKGGTEKATRLYIEDAYLEGYDPEEALLVAFGEEVAKAATATSMESVEINREALSKFPALLYFLAELDCFKLSLTITLTVAKMEPKMWLDIRGRATAETLKVLQDGMG